MFKEEYRELDYKIIRILGPAILENALLIFSGMILTSYIGRLTIDEISAYGIANRIYHIYFAIFKGFAIGALVVIARAYGSGERIKCSELYQESSVLFIPLSILTAFIMACIPKVLLSTMTLDSLLLEEGAQFMRLQILCYPLIAMVHLNSAAFQATGDTKTPLLIAMVGNIVNIVLGYALIFGVGSYHGMGLMGAALSQIVSYIAMTVFGFYLLFGRNGLYEGLFTIRIKLHRADVPVILKAGIPAAIENSFWNVATVYVSRAILLYGQNYYAAYQIGLEAEGFCDMMSAGFMTAAMALSAHAIGAKDMDRYRSSYKRLSLFCVVISAVTMLYLILFSRPTMRLLTDKPELIAIGLSYLAAMVWSQYPQHKQKVVMGYIRSSGYNNVPLIINFIGIWGFRVLPIFLAAEVFHLNIIWVWWAFNLDQWSRELMAEWYFHHHKLLQQ